MVLWYKYNAYGTLDSIYTQLQKKTIGHFLGQLW